MLCMHTLWRCCCGRLGCRCAKPLERLKQKYVAFQTRMVSRAGSCTCSLGCHLPQRKQVDVKVDRDASFNPLPACWSTPH